MTTTTTQSTYRGHDIVVTTYTPNGNQYSYSTAHDDVTGSILIDRDEKDEKTGHYAHGPDAYDTAEQARKASHQCLSAAGC